MTMILEENRILGKSSLIWKWEGWKMGITRWSVLLQATNEDIRFTEATVGWKSVLGDRLHGGCSDHLPPHTRDSAGWDAKFFYLPMSYPPGFLVDLMMYWGYSGPAKAPVMQEWGSW